SHRRVRELAGRRPGRPAPCRRRRRPRRPARPGRDEPRRLRRAARRRAPPRHRRPAVMLSARARGWLGVGLLALAPLWLAACQDPAHQPVENVKNHLPDLRFTLQASDGRTVTERDVAGQVALVFFGYANCPDICPTTL